MDKDVTVLLLSNNGSKTRSFNTRANHIKYLTISLAIFFVLSSCSFFLLYKYYNISRVASLEAEQAKNQLLNTVSALSQNITSGEQLDRTLVKRLILIENKLIDMQSTLKKKGINKSLSIGEDFDTSEMLSTKYLEFLEKDIDGMKTTLVSYPLGKPSSGSASSNFGNRIDPINKRNAFHSGIDLNSRYGNSVIATADGVVEKAGWYGGYGKCVVIRHKNGYKTLYAHLSKIKVKKGVSVKSGQVIGNVGSTGRSTGPHLHYEVIKNNKKINPFPYISLS